MVAFNKCVMHTRGITYPSSGNGALFTRKEKDSKQAAFTRVDLLAVLGGAAVVLFTQLAAHSSTHSSSDTAVCMRNVRLLTQAWAMYADDNMGMFPAADFRNQLAPEWAGEGWLRLPSTELDNVDPFSGEGAIAHGAVWDYSGANPGIWRCPSDPSTGSHPQYMNNARVPRVRSYAMNNKLGSDGWPDGTDWRGYFGFSDFSKSDPASVFVILDVRYDGINDGAFYVGMSGYDPPGIGPTENRAARIVDYPGNYHNQGTVFSFVDGHVEHHI